MSETYVVKSKVAEYVRSKGMMCSSTAYDALSMLVANKVRRAKDRCASNDRKTLKPFDFTKY